MKNVPRTVAEAESMLDNLADFNDSCDELNDLLDDLSDQLKEVTQTLTKHEKIKDSVKTEIKKVSDLLK